MGNYGLVHLKMNDDYRLTNYDLRSKIIENLGAQVKAKEPHLVSLIYR